MKDAKNSELVENTKNSVTKLRAFLFLSDNQGIKEINEITGTLDSLVEASIENVLN